MTTEMTFSELMKRAGLESGAPLAKKKSKPQAKSASAQLVPSACPLITRKNTQGIAHACRFEPHLLQRFIDQRVFDSQTGCPLVSLCGLASPWPKVEEKRPEPQLKWLGFECEHVRRLESSMALWCGKSDQAVFDLTACPEHRWTRDQKGMPKELPQ